MRRREFITIGSVALAWPFRGSAQQPTKAARIRWISRGNVGASDGAMNAFRQGMRELGYAEGQGFIIEPRYADGKPNVMPAQAAELHIHGAYKPPGQQ